MATVAGPSALVLAGVGCFQPLTADSTAGELTGGPGDQEENQIVFRSSLPPVIASAANGHGRQFEQQIGRGGGCT